jgi:two-component system sensor histidine kinase HydH
MLVMNVARVGRIALFAVIVLTGGALFATVFSTYRGVRSSSLTIVRGEAQALADDVRGDLRAHKSTSEILDDWQDDGLTYVAILEGDKVTEEAGTAANGKGQRYDELTKIGSRWRYRPVRARGRRGGGAAPSFIIELEPRVATALEQDAFTTLLLGSLAAGGFLAGALVLVRWFMRREEIERRLAHERRLASLGQMSAVLAHEIRNPLASLKGNAQLLARGLPEGEKPRAKADLVVSEAMRLEALTNDLLEFAKRGEIHRSAADPAALLRDVCVATTSERVRVDVASAPATWSLDAERMRQVLANLVDNALEASGDSGVVEASAAKRDGQLAFVVRDHGPGVPDGELDRLFEPFYTKRVHGTGLGLAVARRFVELHGGTITAHNAQDGGAVFTVLIPREGR